MSITDTLNLRTIENVAFVLILSASTTAFGEDVSTATDPLLPGTFTTTNHNGNNHWFAGFLRGIVMAQLALAQVPNAVPDAATDPRIDPQIRAFNLSSTVSP